MCRFGLDKLALKYTEIYLYSMKQLSKDDSRIELFLKFIGLERDRLPFIIFEAFVKIIKNTNFTVPAIFTAADISDMHINYAVVRSTFKK